MKLRNTSDNGYVNLFTLAGGIDVDAASNFNEDVTFTGASANIVFDKSDNQLEFADNAKAEFGTGGDLEIFHNGTDSILINNTGQLSLRANNLHLTAKNTENYLVGTANGAVELYHDNTKRFETTANGADFTVASGGQVNIFGLGSDNGLRISGPQASSSACLFFNTNHQNVSGGTDQYTIQCGGANNTLMFKHTDTTGNIVFELDDTEHVRIPQDNKALKIGAGQDLQLVHNGTDSTIINSTGDFEIRGAGAGVGNVLLRPKTSENGVIVKPDDAVELYFDNSKKFETTSSGITVSNMLTNGVINISTAANLVIPLEINDSINNNFSTHRIAFQTGGNEVGNISATRSATTYNTSSDYRLKENAVAISDGITRLKTLKPYRFNFISDKDKTVDGFFAHEVTAVPEAITGTKDQVATEDNQRRNIKKGDPIYQSIDQSKLVPLLTAALQEEIVKREALETRVAALEAA